MSDVAQLDRRAFDRFTSGLLQHIGRYGRTLSKNSVHSYIRPVRQLLAWAASEGERVSATPQLPKLPRLYKDVLSREDLALMEAAAPAQRDQLVIRIFADCGLRLSELLFLTAGDIVRSARQASFRIRGKGDRERRVPIPPSLLRRLERHISSLSKDSRSDRLFLSLRRGPLGYHEPLTDSGLKQIVNVAARRAGIERTIHPHVIRHSWVTEMLRSGMNPIQLSVIAGASPTVISRHYEHLTQDDAYEAMIRALTASHDRGSGACSDHG